MPRLSGSRGSRTRTATLVVAILVAAACVVVLGATLRTKGLGTAADVAQLISLVSLLPVLAALIGSWRRARRPVVVTPADLTAARDQLALLVGERWRAEAEVRELHDPDPIPVRWRITRQLHPDTVVTIASGADVPALIDAFDRMRRRRLVILGNAGAGKTTLAVQLLLTLLDQRTERSDAPVPVLFSLADWRPGTNLRRWLAARVLTDYPALVDAGHDRDTIRKLVTEAHVLPVLDGLDEAPDDARAHFVQAADRALGDRIDLVLTCRTDEFRTAAGDDRGLLAALVIEPEPLTAETAADYLESCLPRRPHPAWPEVLRRLREPGSETRGLSEVVSTPLGLWLVRETYITPGSDPAPLLDRFETAAGLRSHLFDELVGATVRARPPSGDPAEIFRPRRQYDPDRTKSSLRFLARNLSSRDVRDLDWTTDFARLFDPPFWPSRAAALLERVMPPVQRAILRGASLGPRRLGGFGALLLAVFTMLCATGWIGALAVLTMIGLAAALLLLVILGTDDSGSIQLDGTDWDKALTEGAEGLNTALNRALARISFALVAGLVAGLPAGAVAHLVLRDPRSWWVALAVTLVVAAVSAVTYPTLPRPGLRAPWYGNRPGQGLARGMWTGLWIGLAAAAALSRAYGAGGTFVVFLALAVPVSCVVLGVANAVAVPLLCALSAPASRPIQRVSVLGDGEPLALWRTDRAAQLGRLARLAVMAASASAAVAATLSAIRHQPYGIAFRQGNLASWLSGRIRTAEIVVPGHWNYLIIAGSALLIAQTLAWSRRRWLPRVAWILLTGLGIALWPHGWGRDDLRLTLRAEFTGDRATFESVGLSRFLGVEATGHAARTLDLHRLVGGGVRTAALVWLIALATVVTATLYRRVEKGHPHLWWPAATAIRRHVRSGRLPRNPLVFLDDCRRLGLLRTVGPIYQFRHADFQDHLAADPAPAPEQPVRV